MSFVLCFKLRYLSHYFQKCLTRKERSEQQLLLIFHCCSHSLYWARGSWAIGTSRVQQSLLSFHSSQRCCACWYIACERVKKEVNNCCYSWFKAFLVTRFRTRDSWVAGTSRFPPTYLPPLSPILFPLLAHHVRSKKEPNNSCLIILLNLSSYMSSSFKLVRCCHFEIPKATSLAPLPPMLLSLFVHRVRANERTKKERSEEQLFTHA